MKKAIIVAIILAGCGDDILPPTWEDAWARWGESVCTYYERCSPDGFHSSYADHEDCVERNIHSACAGATHQCDEAFPDGREERVQACEADMLALECNAFYAPDSCYEAFGD